MNMIARAHQGDTADIVVLDRSDDRWKRLHDIIRTESLKLGAFTLSSGRHSKFLFQLRQTTMLGEGASLISDTIVELMKKLSVHSVGGLELGAVPIATAVAQAGYRNGYRVDAFFVRKQAKPHGAKELVDGYLKPGAEALIVDDVTTAGGSVIKAVDSIKAERGCTVRWALSIVDREEGAAENLAARGIRLLSFFKKSDFEINV